MIRLHLNIDALKDRNLWLGWIREMNIIYGDISLVIFLVDLRTTPIHDSGLNDESSTLDWWPIYLANSDKLHADNIEGLVDCSDV